MATVMPNKPANFRLPQWVLDFVEHRAAERNESKTQVIVEAVACLRDREIAALMDEGYREMAEETLATSEAALPAAIETLPEW
jgi:hypothetical protein